MQISGQQFFTNAFEKSINTSFAWGILSFVTFKNSSVNCSLTTIDSHIRVLSPWISLKSSWNEEDCSAFSSADIIITTLQVGSERQKKIDIYIKPDVMKNLYAYLLYIEGYGFMVFNATFNNIAVTNVYRGGQLYWWGNPEYTEKTTFLSQVTDKLYRIMLYRHERGSNSQLKW